MDLASILRVLGRRSLFILAFGLVGMIVAGATQLTIGSGGLQPKAGSFRGATRILLDTPGADAKSALNLILLALSDAEVVQTQAFAEEISRRVGGAYSPDEVKERFKAFGIAATQIIQIDVAGDSREDAVALSQAAGAAFVDWMTTHQDNAGTSESSRIVATILDTDTVDTVEPASLVANDWLIFGAVAGLTLGVVFAFGLPVPDPKAKRPNARHGSRPRRRAVSLPQLSRSSQA
ncbi:MAG: hypothetical protein K1X95_05455 [Acidimicrobiia bacterium]|nr:hypothetical protein [Acidimicrobiia bacterium]